MGQLVSAWIVSENACLNVTNSKSEFEGFDKTKQEDQNSLMIDPIIHGKSSQSLLWTFVGGFSTP